MLQSVYLLLIFSGFASLYIALVRHRNELLMFMYAFVVFAAVSMASMNVEVVSSGSVISVEVPGMSSLGLGLSMISLILTVAFILDYLPEEAVAPGSRNERGGGLR